MKFYIPYWSILKPGSYTHRGSNIHRVVQQNEWNKCLGPFKHRVLKLVNLINAKIVPYIMENYLILDISLDVCIHPPFGCWYSQLFTAYLSHLLSSCRMHLHVLSVPEWSPCTFINVLASNHVIKLINTNTSTCHSTLDRWTIGNKRRDLNRHQTRLHTGQKSFIWNRCLGFYSDKYCTWCLRYIIWSTWFLDIRKSTCFPEFPKWTHNSGKYILGCYMKFNYGLSWRCPGHWEVFMTG